MTVESPERTDDGEEAAPDTSREPGQLATDQQSREADVAQPGESVAALQEAGAHLEEERFPEEDERPEVETPSEEAESPDSEAPAEALESPEAEAPAEAVESPEAEAPSEVGEATDIQAPAETEESPEVEAPPEVGEAPDIQAPAEAVESPEAEAPAETAESSEAETPSEVGDAIDIQAPVETEESPEVESRTEEPPDVEAPSEEEAPVSEAVVEEPAAVDGDPFSGPGDWYVIHTYAGYENKVKTNLGSRIQTMQMQDKIFDVVVPMEDVMEIKGGRKQVVQKKVFPGYLLVKMVYDNDSWYVVRNTPGVTGFVSSGTGQKPTPLPRREVEKFLAAKTEETKPAFRLEYEEGDVVRIISGPFTEFTGTISEINVDQSKLKVMVNIFDRETPVELGFDQVAKV